MQYEASDLSLECRTREEVGPVWHEVEAQVAAACEHALDDGDAAELLKAMEEGRALLWIVRDRGGKCVASVVTQNHAGRDGETVCAILACSGEQSAVWRDIVLGVIEDHARSHGAAKIVIPGRVGWKRLFPSYRTTHVVLEKRL